MYSVFKGIGYEKRKPDATKATGFFVWGNTHNE
jgi:hypothetical protein